MLQNYLKSAWRNLLKNKFYSLINIAGLSIGLAVGIMVLLWVQDEFSFDAFHKNASSIYKINSHLGKGSSAQIWGDAPAPLAVFCKQSIPEVVNVVRIQRNWGQKLFTYKEKKILQANTAYVDSTFFSLFNFKLIKGNPARPFNDDHSIIVTQSTGRKYFGDNDPIGQILVTDTKENFVVSGVMEDYPENSSISFDMLFPMTLSAKKFRGNGDWKTIDEDLGNYFYTIYVEIRKHVSPNLVANKITQIYHDKRKGEAEVQDNFFSLQPLLSLHLIGIDGNRSALQTVRIFFAVAILILLIACINYVNLSTARSIIRSKEVSVRKIIGAEKFQLFIQFIIESALVFLLASLLAFAIIYSLLPFYNNISGKHLLFTLANSKVWLVFGFAIAGTLAMASIYPAFLLSSFKPMYALRGKLSLGIANTSFRKMLVVTQFVFSVGLIIAAIAFGKQLRYIREKDLGFNKEHLFSFALRTEVHDHFDAVRNELLSHSGILGVASSNASLVGVNSTTGDTDWDGKEPGKMFLIHPTGIDEKLIPLLKMQMKQGQNFSGEKADSLHVILNETAIRQAGIKDPIGKTFSVWQTKAMIIGVVKDFNYASLKQAIEPAVFLFEPAGWRLYIKTTGKDAPKAIAAAQSIWKRYVADYPFDYSFLDEDFDKMYRADQRQGILFNIFSIIAIVISCLGLLGLATYTANIKTKEIGIRKVLGASIAGITNLLVKEFISLVLIAFLIASPLVWWFMNNWLQDFVYRIQIGWWMFAAAGLGAIFIAVLTVGFQAIRAAMADPVKSLRSE